MSAPLPFSLSDGYLIQEDFLWDGNAVTTLNLGTMDWVLAAIGNASTTTILDTTDCGVGQYGVIRDTTAGTADGDGEVYRMDEDTIVLGPSGGSFRMKFRFPDVTGNLIAGNNIKFGLYDETTPTVGVYVYVDGGIPKLYIDSADHGDVSVTAAGVPSLTSGTTCVKGTWYEIYVTFDGENANGGPSSARMWINGEFGGEIVGTGVLDDDEEMHPMFQHWQDTGGTATLEADFDFFEVFVAR